MVSETGDKLLSGGPCCLRRSEKGKNNKKDYEESDDNSGKAKSSFEVLVQLFTYYIDF